MITTVTQDSASAFFRSDDIVFIAQIAASERVLYEGHYNNLAAHYHDRFSFAALQPFGGRQSSIVCRNNVDNTEHVSRTLWLVEALEDLVQTCTRPLILEPSRKEISELGQVATQAGKSILVHYFATSEEDKIHHRREMSSLAKKYAEVSQFTIIDVKEYPTMPFSAGLKNNLRPGISVEDLRSGELFPYGDAEDVSAELLGAFLDNIIGTKAKPFDGLGDEGTAHDEL